MSEFYSLDVTGKVERETHAARLVKLLVRPNEKGRADMEIDLWFPKSQCRMKTDTRMEIPVWLVEAKEHDLNAQFLNLKEEK